MSDLTDEEKRELRIKWGISPAEQDLLERIRNNNEDDDETHYLDTPLNYREDADELIDED
tara:strand:- start:26740 stop:26919 length:180 start_codon:yes stop_codon:yes gene_type:complete